MSQDTQTATPASPAIISSVLCRAEALLPAVADLHLDGTDDVDFVYDEIDAIAKDLADDFGCHEGDKETAEALITLLRELHPYMSPELTDVEMDLIEDTAHTAIRKAGEALDVVNTRSNMGPAESSARYTRLRYELNQILVSARRVKEELQSLFPCPAPITKTNTNW